jgi:sporulation protein YlmC with PRC-barrel domain
MSAPVFPVRVGAAVRASDGSAGKVDAVIVDPVTRRVTHLVVNDEQLAPRRLLPMSQVSSADAGNVSVGLTVDAMGDLERFDEPDFNRPGRVDELELDPGFYFLEPYATPTDGWLLAEHERIPKDEVAIRRGAEVLTDDGDSVGRVDEFLVDPEDGHVTHVVVRTGHLLRKKDVVVPIRAATIDDDLVRLGLSRAEVDQLPHIPVTRHGHIEGADS